MAQDDPAQRLRTPRDEKGPLAGALLWSAESREDQMLTAATAAVTQRPRPTMRAGTTRSRNRSNLEKPARDMTHTFEFEPRGERGVLLFEQR